MSGNVSSSTAKIFDDWFVNIHHHELDNYANTLRVIQDKIMMITKLVNPTALVLYKKTLFLFFINSNSALQTGTFQKLPIKKHQLQNQK